jgi:hypothetical protein
LEELLRLHYRLRFDPRGLSGPERETLTREAKRCLEKLALKFNDANAGWGNPL